MRLTEFVYNLAIHAGLPAVVAGTYASYFGRNPDYQVSKKFSLPSEEFLTDGCTIWIHGASVGEAGIINQVKRLAMELGVPREEVLVSTQTESGLEAVKHPRKFLLPADYPALVCPLSEMVSPDCLAVVETEIWPNLYRSNTGRTILLNGRISDSTYEYYQWLKPLIGVSLNHTVGVYARSNEDAERLSGLGVDPETVREAGDLKWIRALDPPRDGVETPWESDEDSVVTLGSTHPGEERLLLEVLLETEFKINLAPRHLNRLGEVENLLDDLDVDWGRWSELPFEDDRDRRVVLIDEFGLLEGLYRDSDLAFVGGSWKNRGGHNLLEPAQYGIPVITGPHIDNFREMAKFLTDVGVLSVVSSSELSEVVENINSYFDLNDKSNYRGKLEEAIQPIEDRYRRILRQALKLPEGDPENDES